MSVPGLSLCLSQSSTLQNCVSIEGFPLQLYPPRISSLRPEIFRVLVLCRFILPIPFVRRTMTSVFSYCSYFLSERSSPYPNLLIQACYTSHLGVCILLKCVFFLSTVMLINPFSFQEVYTTTNHK